MRFRQLSLFVIMTLVNAAGFTNLDAAERLTIGTISEDNPSETIAQATPFADHLARAVGFAGGKVVVARNLSQMQRLFKEGKVDLFIDSPFPTVKVAGGTGGKYLVRRWKSGVGHYRSVIFTRHDSPVRSLKDLRGKLIAFEDAFSSSGYFVPRLLVAGAGLRLRELEALDAPLHDQMVSYLFSTADVNSFTWVLKGRVAAAAIDDGHFRKYEGSINGKFRVIAESAEIPRQIVSCRSNLPSDLQRRIVQALLSMHESDAGRKVLATFEKTAKFDLLTEEQLRGVRQLERQAIAMRD
jgi:phosphonate transport system substrate-binding protein